MKLALVAANIPCNSPFADRVGMSQSYFKDLTNDETDYCLAVPPGENRLLLLVDEILAEELSRGQK